MTSPVDAICAAVADVAPLLTALRERQRVAVAAPGAQEVLDAVTGALALPGLRVVETTAGLSAAELVIGQRIARAPLGAPIPVASIPAAANQAMPQPISVISGDGAVLRCYVAGDPAAAPVVVVSACGMPAGIASRWVEHLAVDHYVVTWESRGLFGKDDGFDERHHDLAAQAADLLAVMSRFEMDNVHVIGLCGGAAIALAAAASPRVRSLSLWHGDFELGSAAAKTAHQQDVAMLLAMSGRDRERAEKMQQMFRRPSVLATLRPDIAHHLYYPYATAELLYRYGRLNGAIMSTDCRPLLAAVTQPTLVVTSDEDTTAHPDGSRYVAQQLADGHLRLLPHGDHLAAFDAAPELLTMASAFIARTRNAS
ncbi:hypothetical protein OG203_17640 [Nocardia sp. NBC_01499]|uniref:alpha/beta fold hydrolase n=1 Tax=Nocardia sp. NBC_01499 TaxID=2903597 RepID=UPI00386D68F2